MSTSSSSRNGPRRQLRRSYSAAVFGGPWLLGLGGLGLILFGLLGQRPVAIQVACLTGGIIMSIVGLLALRISGPVEVTPKGLKGTIESIPADALFIARDAADRALPDQGEGFSRARSILADGAAFQALENFSLIQASAQVMDLDELMRRILLYSAANTKDEVPYVVRLLQENPKVDLDESSKELISRILELAQNSDIPKATSRPAEPAEPIDISEVDVSVDVGEHEPPDE